MKSVAAFSRDAPFQECSWTVRFLASLRRFRLMVSVAIGAVGKTFNGIEGVLDVLPALKPTSWGTMGGLGERRQRGASSVTC
jgi:hypothetical protein